MNENNNPKKVDPWQLITILIVVLVVLSGQFMLNQTLNTRLDSIEKMIESDGDSTRLYLKALSGRIDIDEKEARKALEEVEEAVDEVAEEATDEDTNEADEEKAPEEAEQADEQKEQKAEKKVKKAEKQPIEKKEVKKAGKKQTEKASE